MDALCTDPEDRSTVDTDLVCEWLQQLLVREGVLARDTALTAASGLMRDVAAATRCRDLQVFETLYEQRQPVDTQFVLVEGEVGRSGKAPTMHL